MNNLFRKTTVLLLILSVSIVNVIAQSSETIFEQVVYLPKQKANIYTILNELSSQTGLLFIYDSKIVNNESIVRIKGGKRRLGYAIKEIVGDSIHYENIGKHILLSSNKHNTDKAVADSTHVDYYIFEGRLLDAQTNAPIAFGSIGVLGTSLGTISNNDGIFKLILPKTTSDSSEISFSHLVYEQQIVSFKSVNGRFINVSLHQRIMNIPEIIIRAISPIKMIEKMKNNISKNYFGSPAYLTTFYREGIYYDDNFKSLTEAVIKLYKSSYKRQSSDQVQLMKMRKVTNFTTNDTIIAKMSSGIDASLQLDVIKEVPDFISSIDDYSLYEYRYIESTIVDDRRVDVISFKQKSSIIEPHYAGKLYINSDDYALVRVEMSILPNMVKKATDMFVTKQSQNVKLTLDKVNYIINYKKFGKHYFINHIRGDIYFKAKRRKRLFGTSLIHTWFEMLPCKIDTTDVVRFNRSERLLTNTVFSETSFEYDHDFWGEYNSIALEREIEDVIKDISPLIEIIK